MLEDDRAKPGSERGRLTNRPQFAIRIDECFLCDILCQVVVAEVAVA
jgi:hypothetical protein